MADIAITPGSVLPGSNATQVDGTAGGTITAGMAVYFDSSTQTWKPAQANGAAALSGNGTSYGIALNGASAGQPLKIDTNDANGITIGGTTVVGEVYVVSAANAGGIAPLADLASTNRVTILGVGQTGDKIVMVTNGNTGIQKA